MSAQLQLVLPSTPTTREAGDSMKAYFSAAELAGLAGMPGTARGVKLRAQGEAWPSRARLGRGGGLEYPVACLPAETQAALAERMLSAAPARQSAVAAPPPNGDLEVAGASFSSARCDERAPGAVGPGAHQAIALDRAASYADPRAESLGRIYEDASTKRKERARAALAIVQQCDELVRHGMKSTVAAATVASARGIDESTVQRLLKKVRGEPRDLWLFLLLDGHRGRTARAEISPEAWDVLKASYLRKPARTAKSCIVSVREANAKGGFGWTLPSDRTMERLLADIPRDVRVLARRGRDELLRMYPAQQRAKSALAALDIVNGDGYSHKGIWVEFPDGEIRRAKTWFWADVYSSRFLTWRTDKTENTEVIRLSFGDLVERFGIPRAVLLDNTRAAANKAMSGGVKHRFRFKVKDEEPAGIFKLLGIDVMWATPYHGQAKPIERAFGIGGIGEYVDRAPEFAQRWDESDSYSGKTRPVKLAELERVIAREVAAANARADRKGAIHQGRSWDEVFDESYARITVHRATAEQCRYWLLMTEPTRVHRDGTIVLDAGRMVGEQRANRYWARELGDYAGQLVAARFDPARLHEGVHVYAAKGGYIAFAECLKPAGFNDANAGREQMRDRNAYAKATKAALELERRMSARAAGERLDAGRSGDGASADRSLPAPKVIEAVFRDPLERPAYLPRERTPEEKSVLAAEAAAIEAELAAPPVNVLELRSDADKHAHWKALDARRAAAERLPEHDEAFWQHWQTQDYYRLAIEAEAAFEEGLKRTA